METKMNDFKLNLNEKINYKNWQFWFKLLLPICTLLIIWIPAAVDIINIYRLADAINNAGITTAEGLKPYQHEALYVYISIIADYGNNIHQSDIAANATLKASANITLWFTCKQLTFFTETSNYAVCIWLLIAAFNPKKEGIKGYLGARSTMIVASYITITMLIAMCWLIPMEGIPGLLNEPSAQFDTTTSGVNLIRWTTSTAGGWVNGMWLHVVNPIAFIVYIACVYSKKLTNYNSNNWKRNLIPAISILLGYGVYTLIKGEFLHKSGVYYSNQYPYFFFQIHTTFNGVPGVVYLIISMGLIIGIYTVASLLFNRRFTKWSIK